VSRIDRLVERQPAVVDRGHRRGGGDRLGHRRDPEDRVAAHRLAAAGGGGADHLDLGDAAPGDQRDQAGDLAAGDMARQGGVHAAVPRGRIVVRHDRIS
jgi:hypothetical protein